MGFLFSYFSLVTHSGISEIRSGEFWIEETLPFLYWIGIIVIATSIFLLIRFPRKRFYPFLFVISCALLMICLRMVLPVISASPVLYEPDTNNYITVVSSWLKSGIDFGREGNYQHDYPLAYVFAFFFTKLGVPIDVFFRFAPLFVYTINIIILYFLYCEITFENKRISSGAVFLFALSSLGYWMSVHYCPDLIGTVFYLLSLYLCVKFAGKHRWEITAVLPACTSIFLLILSHHLGTLYLTLTLLGLSLSTGLNKSPEIKEQWIKFFVLGIYTYTLWFAYGSFMYPSFFNIYVYFQFSGSPVSLAQNATLFDNITFAIYPAFILVLFVYGFLRGLNIKKISDLTKLFTNIRMTTGDPGILKSYSIGYIFLFVFLIVGFILPTVQSFRLLEVLLIGVYPISSQALVNLYGTNHSRKMKVLLFSISILVMLTSVHRFYREIQKRVTFSK